VFRYTINYIFSNELLRMIQSRKNGTDRMATQQETNSEQNGAGAGKSLTTRPASVTDSPG